LLAILDETLPPVPSIPEIYLVKTILEFVPDILAGVTLDV
jgi:hypothetical protein